MSLKSFTLACLCLFFSAKSLAQLPPPCPSNAFPPADVCSQACVYCNLISIQSTTAGYTSQTPPGFCGTIENEQWLGFTASAGAATFTATPTGCTNGDGVQIAIYESCLGMPIACYGGCGGCEGTPANVTVGLVPGQVYFLLIDGFAGDQCDFTLTSNPPMFAPSVVPDSLAAIIGPDTTCVRATDIFEVPQVANADEYIWEAPPGTTINGQASPAKTVLPSATVVWGDEDGEICVRATNVCSGTSTPAVCKSVKFRSDTASMTILPDLEICSGLTPYLLPWGDSVWFTGVYGANLTNQAGCDSTVRVSVKVQPPRVRDFGYVWLCDGDCFTVFGQDYCQPYSNFNLHGTASDGCDSIVRFTIQPVPQAEAIILPGGPLTLTCSQPTVQLLSNPVPWFYSTYWVDSQGVGVSSNPVATVTEPGLYTLQIASTTGWPGCRFSDEILVKENIITPSLTASGGTITPQNPLVQLRARSVNSPVQYRWEGPQGFASNLQNPIVGVAGIYTVTVWNTQTQCFNSKTVEVKQQ
ncbi:MAG: hypothetical protein ACK4Q5_18625 [Saprospiraceae bacterium]